jgi:hypothetical protein
MVNIAECSFHGYGCHRFHNIRTPCRNSYPFSLNCINPRSKYFVNVFNADNGSLTSEEEKIDSQTRQDGLDIPFLFSVLSVEKSHAT